MAHSGKIKRLMRLFLAFCQSRLYCLISGFPAVQPIPCAQEAEITKGEKDDKEMSEGKLSFVLFSLAMFSVHFWPTLGLVPFVVFLGLVIGGTDKP